ncbi:MAG: MinD/ParA family protein [Thermodesulfovibrionales bacterium]
MQKKVPHVIAVSSGKGGVGKTNFVVNLATYLCNINKKVLIIDADLGLANIDVLFGIAPKYNLKHVLLGQKRLQDIIIKGPHDILILPASSGVRELTNLNKFQKIQLLSEIETLDIDLDVILIDTGAGIYDNVLFFCSSAQDIIVVVTSEPTSLADAYALIKVLCKEFKKDRFKILINMARTEKEAFNTFRKLAIVADKFLNLSVDYLGYLPYEQHVKDAIIAQKSFISLYPNSSFSKRLSSLGDKILNVPQEELGGIQLFFKRALGVV